MSNALKRERSARKKKKNVVCVSNRKLKSKLFRTVTSILNPCPAPVNGVWVTFKECATTNNPEISIVPASANWNEKSVGSDARLSECQTVNPESKRKPRSNKTGMRCLHLTG